jgi:hypothetical protein
MVTRGNARSLAKLGAFLRSTQDPGEFPQSGRVQAPGLREHARIPR